MIMGTYKIVLEVTNYETYIVTAESEEEAINKFGQTDPVNIQYTESYITDLQEVEPCELK